MGITWLVTLAALIGVVLNIKKDKRCFMIWIVTNLFWSVYDWTIGAHAQAVLFGIYFLLSAYGLWEWGRSNGNS